MVRASKKVARGSAQDSEPLGLTAVPTHRWARAPRSAALAIHSPPRGKTAPRQTPACCTPAQGSFSSPRWPNLTRWGAALASTKVRCTTRVAKRSDAATLDLYAPPSARPPLIRAAPNCGLQYCMAAAEVHSLSYVLVHSLCPMTYICLVAHTSDVFREWQRDQGAGDGAPENAQAHEGGEGRGESGA